MRQRWAIGVLDLGTPLPGPGFRRPSGKEDTGGVPWCESQRLSALRGSLSRRQGSGRRPGGAWGREKPRDPPTLQAVFTTDSQGSWPGSGQRRLGAGVRLRAWDDP